jgi:class 3 adenylate cyclase
VADHSFPGSDYRPRPIDISQVELDPHLRQLTESLAEHTHDLWAQLRFAQGWQYGPVRDDTHKRHPCLIPYQDLPESEKEHDRNTALGTVRALLALGYDVAPPSGVAASAAAVSVEEVMPLLEELQDKTLGLEALQGVWEAHSSQQWSPFPELYALLGLRLIGCDSPFLAFEVLSEGLNARPADLRLRQLAANALARAGATFGANARMQQLYDEGHRDEETLGILGRTHKDLALAAVIGAERQRHFRLAFRFYAEGFTLTGKSYPGINAATMAFLLGERGDAMTLAEGASRAAAAEMKAVEGGSSGYWEMATLAEAALLLQREPEAATRYREAVSIAGERFADLASTRRNARLILEATGRPLAMLDELVPVPRVVVFTGHMIDRPDRASPRFPASAESRISQALDARLAQLGAGIGFSSAASGGDILFLEAMARRGGKTSIVLPYPETDFIPHSVLIGEGDEWVPRFESVLRRSESVRRAVGQRFADSPVFFEYANLLLLGLARLRSARLGVDLVPLALWDGRKGDGAGGTAGTIEEWRSQGYNVEVIDLNALVAIPATSPPEDLAAPAVKAGLETRIMAVLFADVVNFSRLTESEIPRFVDHFLGAVGGLVRESAHAPIVSNTWGDGLYFVFETVADAGEWALELCEMAATTDWNARGLRKDLNLRVALHAGPLFSCIDPVTNQRNFTGKQVVPAARLEPVTPPGLVYASEEFAAMAAASQVSGFTCQPVGRLGLAKGAGNVQVYHVSRVTPTRAT